MIMTIAALCTAISVSNMMLESINNNVINAKSEGYQAIHPFITDLAPTVCSSAVAQQAPTMVGSGIEISGSHRDTNLGTLNHTKDPLNLVIAGTGYFRLSLADASGYRYTRNGRFSIDPTTRQLARGKNPLSDNIFIPENIALDSITILGDGQVQGTDGDGNVQDLGQIIIYNPVDPQILDNDGDGLLKYKSDSTSPSEDIAITANVPGENCGMITQGVIEGSNVNIEMEMINMRETSLWQKYCLECVKQYYKNREMQIETIGAITL